MKPTDLKQLRIVISGPVGSGKTSLTTAIARHFEIPHIEENLKKIYQAKIQCKKILRETNDPIIQKRAYDQWMGAYVDWFKNRTNLYNQHAAFVADRWEADILGLWLRLFSGETCEGITKQMLSDMRNKANTFDAAIILPMIDLDSPLKNEDGLTRRKDFNSLFSSHLMTGALVRQCQGLRRIYIPNNPMSIDERLEFVMRELSKTR
ncbi:AAA family ATPase [Undibacterium fentianense]|uniref:AAA family ATPase n=1 Tax=Undibacterium fentianense TaxID=2828728 RepID=A0A941IDK7_9BURK|nr:AAA family ATPase [Undibacterium fentianense]MBR7798676.1 AAA family ATPase [Undibacterium fentianense]